MSNSKPTHRVSFSRLYIDKDGKEQVGSANQIGAIWPREGKKGGILRFDHIPMEMTQHNGVIFITEA